MGGMIGFDVKKNLCGTHVDKYGSKTKISKQKYARMSVIDVFCSFVRRKKNYNSEVFGKKILLISSDNIRYVYNSPMALPCSGMR